jgi:hypothetical protein
MAVLHLSTATQNALADTVTAQIDAGAAAGTIEIYDGSMPADANTAPSGQTLLGTLTFNDPSFGAASTGTITANAITADASADATGTASWGRILDSDSNVIAHFDVTGSGGGGVMELNSTSITAGGEISVTSFTFTMPSGA